MRIILVYRYNLNIATHLPEVIQTIAVRLYESPHSLHRQEPFSVEIDHLVTNTASSSVLVNAFSVTRISDRVRSGASCDVM